MLRISKWKVCALLGMVAVVLCLTWWGLGDRWATGSELLHDAKTALANKDFSRAEALATRVLARRPRQAAALLIAGEAATRQNRWDDALRYYAQIPDDASTSAALGHYAAGDLLLQQGHASRAEKEFLRTVELEPKLTVAYSRLAYLYSLVGRRWESLPYLLELVRRDQFSLDNLLLLGRRTAEIELPDELRRYRDASPGDPLPLLGLAKLAVRQGRVSEARKLLRQMTDADPQQIEAQAVLGRLLLEDGAVEELTRWHRALPAAADAHPDIWAVRGSWAKQHGQPEAAQRSFWQALALDPNHEAAIYQLAQLLSASHAEVAGKLATRATKLQRLSAVLDLLYERQTTAERLREATDLTESLGRMWEAWAWHRVAGRLHPDLPWAREGLLRLQARLSSDTPMTLATSNPAREIDLSAYPLPRWSPGTDESPRVAAAEFCFRDVAATAGIDFTYHAGYQGQLTGRKMYQFTGGGVAAFDYDGDGWPDLYFTQGGPWPPPPIETAFRDRLYRNQGGAVATDVTEAARLTDHGFGQGVAVGDFNCDGFADLYVANIGRNRLLMNCGDGTFMDVTETAGLDERRWTTSCLLADLNGDGLPDIYDVNYVQGADVFDKICEYADGSPGVCPPTVFEPQPDNFYVNLGDGRFSDETAAAGLNVAGGNGLGIVAADFDGSGRLGLFVANDQDANSFFVNQTPERGGRPRFVERGAIAGLAFGSTGKAQASMGVAAGDANADGAIDLFVTNFYQEPNALYLQSGGGLFSDEIETSGIREAGFGMLGFGTQFLDGDLDGLEELVVANGHIDDFTARGTPYRMRPQFFRNTGGGRFETVNFSECGDYFTREAVGRGLARLDFDRDGRPDFVVSQLDSPAALVLNYTWPTGHFLSLRASGVASSRDAIGAVVTVETAGSRWVRQLTAGDGYQASNERVLFFGLGPHDRAQVTVAWPAGSKQVFSDVAAGQCLLVIEGRDELFRIGP